MDKVGVDAVHQAPHPHIHIRPWGCSSMTSAPQRGGVGGGDGGGGGTFLMFSSIIPNMKYV